MGKLHFILIPGWVDREELKRAFEKKPKALILCNPSNKIIKGVYWIENR